MYSCWRAVAKSWSFVRPDGGGSSKIEHLLLSDCSRRENLISRSLLALCSRLQMASRLWLYNRDPGEGTGVICPYVKSLKRVRQISANTEDCVKLKGSCKPLGKMSLTGRNVYCAHVVPSSQRNLTVTHECSLLLLWPQNLWLLLVSIPEGAEATVLQRGRINDTPNSVLSYKLAQVNPPTWSSPI